MLDMAATAPAAHIILEKRVQRPINESGLAFTMISTDFKINQISQDTKKNHITPKQT